MQQPATVDKRRNARLSIQELLGHTKVACRGKPPTFSKAGNDCDAACERDAHGSGPGEIGHHSDTVMRMSLMV